MRCWHGDTAGVGHPHRRPGCPEKPVIPYGRTAFDAPGAASTEEPNR